MNPRLASSMSVIALLGLIWHLAPPSDAPAEKPSASETQQGQTDKKADEPKPPHLGPWVATCRFFGHDPNPDFCIAPGFRLSVMIATIPDPSKTRLGLFADRTVDSIQRGARAAGWEFDSQWLPWKFAEDDAGVKRWLPKDPYVAEPGLLIFRRGAAEFSPAFPRQLLLVFVAGETPTAGVDHIAFRKILSYRKIVDPALAQFDIAGPTFSGSLPSLAFALEGNTAAVRRIYSGTVTYRAYADTFRRDTGIDFRSAMQDSATTTEQLHAAALRLGIPRGRVAILSEDETAFGSSFNGLVTIPFPREISSLRNATQTNGGQPSGSSPNASGSVPFSLHDADGGEDSVPLWGRSQTALSQYSMVTAIVNRIRGHFDLVEIAATNVLDALFLAGALHDGAPDTRVLVPTADLLYIRAAREQSLTGILTLTPYPLFLPNRDWTNAGSEIDVFADGNSEGLYNAMYLLLANSRGDYCLTQSAVCDYNLPPSPGVLHPAGWLAESTATGYWPVTVFAPPSGDGLYPPLENGQFLAPMVDEIPLPLQWWILTVFAIALTLWLSWAFWHATGTEETHVEMFRTSLRGHRVSETFAPVALALAALGCCLSMLAVLLFPSLSQAVTHYWSLTAIGGLAALAALLAGGWIAVESGFTDCGWPPTIVLLTAIPSAVCIPFFHASGWDRKLMAIRFVEIQSGCSAAVPLVLIAAGLLFAALLHMNRLSMTDYRNPGIPDGGLEPAVQHNLNAFAAHAEAILRHPAMRIPREHRIAPVLAVLIILAVWTRPWRDLYTVDGRAFSLVLFVLAFALLAALAWSTVGVTMVWKNLKGFLAELNRLPLGGAFRRLPRQFSGSAIWAGMPMSRTFVTFYGSAETLAEFLIAYRKLPRADPCFALRTQRRLLRLEARTAELREWEQTGKLKDHRKFVRQFRESADFLQAEFLTPKWENGKTDPDPGPENSTPKEKTEPLAAPQPAASGEDEVYRLAARFVALRYAAWLRYMLRHIRNLMVFISGGYALLSVALLSLDFQSPQTIRWFLTFVFLAIGAPLLRCIAQMDRDAVLSRMANTTVGELNTDFYVKALSYVGLPLVGVLSNQFPAFSRIIFSWMQPTLNSLK